eukprot:UC1_evm1s269
MGKKDPPEGVSTAPLIEELREAIKDVPDAEGYAEDERTLVRYLRARNWKVKKAADMLKASLLWRADYRPSTRSCTYCQERTGYHSWRQVGYDKEGRPVTYSCISQGETSGLVPEDCVLHAACLIENMVPSCKQDASTYVWVLDFTGITMGSCNPRLALATNKLMANHYPERLGYVLLVNAPWLFNATWAAVKLAMDADTVAKIIFVKDSQLHDTLHERFPPELAEWTEKEIELNRRIKEVPHQVEWYKAPPEGHEYHDPRGCPSYLEESVLPYLAGDETRSAASQEHTPDGQHVLFASKIHLPHCNFVPAGSSSS